jgi:hypothetical protein
MPEGTDFEAEHLVAFPISGDLHERIHGVLARLREAERPSERVSELIDVVVEMTDRGLTHYFLTPLEVAGVGRISQATAKVGLASVGKGLPLVIRKVLSSASDEELLALADFVEDLLVETTAE